jgi:medium-chain acyl-[acyl-carrier-protein] hydrolase
MAMNSYAGPSWFQRLSPARTPLLRVFCFPYAGGTAEIYRTWQRWLPEQIDVCLVHLPGRGRRMKEQSLRQFRTLVIAIADRVPHETNVSYALYGHSMGALLSFELARELFRRYGRGPKHLFVSGCRAPQWPRTEPPTFNLPHDQFIAELKRLKGTPDEILKNPELLEQFIAPLRADFEVVDTYEYRPGEQLPCPINVYGGIQDTSVPMESCRAWQEQSSAVCKVRMLKGDHFFIRDPRSEFISVFRNDVLSAIPASREQEDLV